MSEPADTPVLNVVQPTPKRDRDQFIADDDVGGNFQDEANRVVNGDDVIDEQPHETSAPSLSKENLPESSPFTNSEDSRSSITLSDAGSGYQRDSNECTEFCIEFCSCFGTFDACCPSDGEGCLTSFATFCGNLIFSCCKC